MLNHLLVRSEGCVCRAQYTYGKMTTRILIVDDEEWVCTLMMRSGCARLSAGT